MPKPSLTTPLPTSILLVLVLAALPASAADFGLRGVSLHAGINTSSDFDDGATLGLTVSFAELTDGLFLAGGLFYSEADATECGGFSGGFCSFDLELDVEDLAVGAEVRYFLRGEAAGFYFGGGPYLHQLSVDSVGTLPGTPIVISATDESDRVGVMGVAGYQLRRGFAELRYSAVSDFNAALFLVGFTFGGR